MPAEQWAQQQPGAGAQALATLPGAVAAKRSEQQEPRACRGSHRIASKTLHRLTRLTRVFGLLTPLFRVHTF